MSSWPMWGPGCADETRNKKDKNNRSRRDAAAAYTPHGSLAAAAALVPHKHK